MTNITKGRLIKHLFEFTDYQKIPLQRKMKLLNDVKQFEIRCNSCKTKLISGMLTASRRGARRSFHYCIRCGLGKNVITQEQLDEFLKNNPKFIQQELIQIER